MALVNCRHSEKFCRGCGGGDGSFPSPVHRGNVVGGVLRGAFADVVSLNGGFLLKKAPGELEVRVVDVAVRVGVCDKSMPDVGRESVTPQNWMLHREAMTSGGAIRAKGDKSGDAWCGGGGFEKPHSSSTKTRGIVSTHKTGCSGHEFL